MNRSMIATLLTAAVGLSACGRMSESTDPSAIAGIKPSLAMLGNSRDRFDGIATGCPGSEDVAITVFFRFIAAQTVDGAGALHVNGHLDWNFTGTGVVTGTKYVGAQQDKLTA